MSFVCIFLLSIIRSRFDTIWSGECFTFSNSNKTATFAKRSIHAGISNNYNMYPVVRLDTLFTSSFVVEFTPSGYSWFGLIAEDCVPHGFPGYTDKGWMICIDGRFYHNNKLLMTKSLLLPLTLISVAYKYPQNTNK